MAGLTSNGFTSLTRAELIDQLVTSWEAEFSAPPGRVALKIIGLVAAGLSLVWQGAQALYDQLDPDKAEGVVLDHVCALVGVTRQGATYTAGTVTLTGTPGTVIAAGKIVRNSATEDDFITQAEVTIPGGGSADVAVQAENTGPIEADIGDIDTIVTPVAGWASVTNAAALTTGRDAETDGELRIRRTRSLQIVGSGADGALRARLEALSDVVAAQVTSNRSLTTDGEGIPPKAFRAVVYPSTADGAQIARTLWDHQPAGIESHGSESYTVTDDQGYAQAVEFSYATEVPLYIEVDVTSGAGYPADATALITAAIEDHFGGLGVGDDVGVLDLTRAVLCAVEDGITDLTIKVDDVDPPVASGDYAITSTQIAVLAVGGVEVV